MTVLTSFPLLAMTSAMQAEDAVAFKVENSEVHTVASARSGRSYDVFVRLPPGYDRSANASRRYPVLYLTDGPHTFQVASDVARAPFSQGRLEEFIIVGLSHVSGENARTSRSRDLTPWKRKDRPAAYGGAAVYLDHIRSDVMPLVEQRYRIDPARRVLGGHSYGGLFGLWVALTEPELFSAYLLTSPSIWYNDRALLALEAARVKKNGDLKATIYLATGSLERPTVCKECRVDMVGDQTTLVRNLKSRNYPGLRIRDDIIEGTVHETTFPAGLLRGLMWIFPPKG